MNSYTQQHILQSFRGATRSEIRRVTFAADFADVDFDRLDYYGWQDRKIPRRAYIVVEREAGPVALLLTRADAKPRGRAMCTWCNDVNLSDEAVLYTVRRGGAAGRKGDTLGVMICASFGCAKNVRSLPPAFHAATDLEEVRAARIADLRRRIRGFVDEVLSTDD